MATPRLISPPSCSDPWTFATAYLARNGVPAHVIPTSITITLAHHALPLTIPLCPGPAGVTSAVATPVALRDELDGLPPLSATQKKIMVALAEAGPLKGDALASRCKLSSRTSLHGRRGMTPLIEMGLVVNGEDDGYALTEFGEDVAEKIAEG